MPSMSIESISEDGAIEIIFESTVTRKPALLHKLLNIK